MWSGQTGGRESEAPFPVWSLVIPVFLDRSFTYHFWSSVCSSVKWNYGMRWSSSKIFWIKKMMCFRYRVNETVVLEGGVCVCAHARLLRCKKWGIHFGLGQVCVQILTLLYDLADCFISVNFGFFPSLMEAMILCVWSAEHHVWAPPAFLLFVPGEAGVRVGKRCPILGSWVQRRGWFSQKGCFPEMLDRSLCMVGLWGNRAQRGEHFIPETSKLPAFFLLDFFIELCHLPFTVLLWVIILSVMFFRYQCPSYSVGQVVIKRMLV